MAQKKPKKVDKLDYKDCKIEIRHFDVDKEVRIDSDDVTVEQDPDTGAYRSPEAPYQRYGTLEELAKAVIDARKEESGEG